MLTGGADITFQPESSRVCGNFSSALLFFFARSAASVCYSEGPRANIYRDERILGDVKKKVKQQIFEHIRTAPTSARTEVMTIINNKKGEILVLAIKVCNCQLMSDHD